MNKGKESKKKAKKEEEPIDDLTEKDGESLRTLISQCRERLTEVKTKRNYIQNDRDMVEQFYNNTRKEVDEFKMKIVNKETEMEELEQKHRTDVKVYTQKMKHLEYDQRMANNDILKKAEDDQSSEDKDHKERLEEMKQDKNKKKQEIRARDTQYEDEVKTTEKNLQKDLSLMQEELDKLLRSMTEDYEQKLKKLKADLELKLKVEIHEIEERKNQHINDLMKHHEAAFKELKDYFNDITAENLNLIKSQKATIEDLQGSLAANTKQVEMIKASNKQLEKPLQEQTEVRNKLKENLKQHAKDKMSMVNLNIKLSTLTEKINKLKREQEDLDAKFTRVLKEKEELEYRFENITNEIKMHADAKNIVLMDKLSKLEELLDNKEAQLQALIQRTILDKNIMEQLMVKIQQSIEAKNTLIKNLKYSIHHATKAYNDAIRVYEAKLTEFGIPPEELGFQPLETITSTMPAGLVSS